MFKKLIQITRFVDNLQTTPQQRSRFSYWLKKKNSRIVSTCMKRVKFQYCHSLFVITNNEHFFIYLFQVLRSINIPYMIFYVLHIIFFSIQIGKIDMVVTECFLLLSESRRSALKAKQYIYGLNKGNFILYFQSLKLPR